MAPSILQRLRTRDDGQLAALIRDGIPLRGMPPNLLGDAEMTALVRFLRTIEREPAPEAAPRTFKEIPGGGTIEGAVLGEGFDDLQVRTADGRVRLLRREGGGGPPVTSGPDWPAHNGGPRRTRHTTPTPIPKTDGARRVPRRL